MIHRTSRLVSRAPVLTLAVLLLGCCNTEQRGGASTGSDPTKKTNADRDLIVATVGSKKITVGELNDELEGQNPYLRMRFSSLERKKEFLKNLVRFEVLAQEARHKKLQKDPEVIRRVKRAMVDKLLDELHASLVKLEAITDQEVEAYYRANHALYHQPVKVRVSQIVTASEAEATKVLALAKQKPGDTRHFGDLAEKHSIDEGSKKNRGDLGFISRDSGSVPKEIMEAALAIKGTGQLAGPIKTEKGYVVLCKTGEMPEVQRPLEAEKDHIKNRLLNEKRLKAVEDYIAKLQAQAKVQINEANLAKVSFAPKQRQGLVPPPPRGGREAQQGARQP
jgi:peptidyl-prolyl cis-trans isomerase C